MLIPHVSGDVAVVHTVLLKTTKSLKMKSKRLGYIFTSQTDTEVVAHLVNDALKQTDSLLEAVQNTYSSPKGHFCAWDYAYRTP